MKSGFGKRKSYRSPCVTSPAGGALAAGFVFGFVLGLAVALAAGFVFGFVLDLAAGPVGGCCCVGRDDGRRDVDVITSVSDGSNSPMSFKNASSEARRNSSLMLIPYDRSLGLSSLNCFGGGGSLRRRGSLDVAMWGGTRQGDVAKMISIPTLDQEGWRGVERPYE